MTNLQICSRLFNFSNFLLLNFPCFTLTKPTHAHKWLAHRRQKETKYDTASFQCSVSVLNVESHFIIYNNYYQAFFRSDEKKNTWILPSLNTYLDYKTGQLFIFRNLIKTWSVALTFQKPWDFFYFEVLSWCACFLIIFFSLNILLSYIIYKI